MENKKFKFVIRGQNKGVFQREVLTLLNISNHNAFICSDGAGIDGLTVSQLHKVIDYICSNYPDLTIIIK